MLALESVAAQDENDEDFVIVSLLVADPGDILYSCVGHACLRMQCPQYDLDYCFSYEGEDVHHQFLRFFAGKLKMGMMAVPSKEYISLFKAENRGLRQYRLNLPLGAKRRLWELLDNKVAEGVNLPYDYLQRGCAQTMLKFLVEVLDTTAVDYAPWGEKYQRTRREFVASYMQDSPWSRLCLYTIVGIESDKDCSNFDKVVIPTDLLEVLKGAKIGSKAIITDAPVELSPSAEREQSASWFTPMLLAVICVILAIASWFVGVPCIDWTLLTLQTLIGVFVVYLLCISTLPANDWNWLVIPFNPLPALLWRWRKHWALLFTGVLVVWDVVMLFYPHQLTDWAYVVLVVALIVLFLKHGRNARA